MKDKIKNINIKQNKISRKATQNHTNLMKLFINSRDPDHNNCNKLKTNSTYSKKVSTACTECTTDFQKSCIAKTMLNQTHLIDQQKLITQIGGCQHCFNLFLDSVKIKCDKNKGNSKESLQKERKSVQPKVIPKILDENSQKICITEENSKESIDTDCPQNVSECSSKDANIILKVDPFKSNTKQHKGINTSHLGEQTKVKINNCILTEDSLYNTYFTNYRSNAKELISSCDQIKFSCFDNEAKTKRTKRYKRSSVAAAPYSIKIKNFEKHFTS